MNSHDVVNFHLSAHRKWGIEAFSEHTMQSYYTFDLLQMSILCKLLSIVQKHL